MCNSRERTNASFVTKVSAVTAHAQGSYSNAVNFVQEYMVGKSADWAHEIKKINGNQHRGSTKIQERSVVSVK